MHCEKKYDISGTGVIQMSYLKNCIMEKYKNMQWHVEAS